MNKLIERASIETLYDSIKWLAFLYLAAIWLGETPNIVTSRWPWLIAFILVLFLINICREKELNKYK